MAKNKQKDILVTTALPYANGPIHLGHMLEHVQTDIFVRAKKLQGHNILYFCADDAHGAPIMIKAAECNEDPEKFTKKIQKEHIEDFMKFSIDYTNYHTTHSKENKDIVNNIYECLCKNNLVYTKKIEQFFDETESMFLADRYIIGTCPKCKAENQYGDACEKCGSTYPTESVINPKSILSSTTPILKKTDQVFFKLSKFKQILKNFINKASLQPSVKSKLNEWLKGELKDWNISRDKPYFGFEIPDQKDKYFYVWLDAPVGYIASTKNWADQNRVNYLDLWSKDSQYEIHHFIGKDIIYFHGLFWPAVLYYSDYKIPNRIHAHGFLSINSEKMSKSKGTFITAKNFSKIQNTDLLRYYFASKLNSKIEDIDLDFDDYVQKINSNLVGKLFNIGSRLEPFIRKNDYNLSNKIDKDFYHEQLLKYDFIIQSYNANEYSKAINSILSIADDINSYINYKKPWTLDDLEAIEVSSTIINLYKDLCILINPVMPNLSNKALNQFNIEDPDFTILGKVLGDTKINNYVPILDRLDTININDLN